MDSWTVVPSSEMRLLGCATRRSTYINRVMANRTMGGRCSCERYFFQNEAKTAVCICFQFIFRSVIDDRTLQMTFCFVRHVFLKIQLRLCITSIELFKLRMLTER